MEININSILIVLITSSIGAIVRILHENEKERIKNRKIFLIYACSLAIGYLCYELAINYDKENWLGFSGILGGLISVDLVTLIIEKLPEIIKNKLTKKIKENGLD
jgi:hypothetical protein